MASSQSFVKYIVEQLGAAGIITYKKMFGEYGIYCNGTLFALICDDRLFVKITDAVRSRYSDLPQEPPYEGAKNYFRIDNVDDCKFLTALTLITVGDLPEPKLKKKRS